MLNTLNIKRSLYVLFALLITIYAVMNPKHNWDMIAYVASAEAYDEHDKIIIHDSAYEGLKEHVSAETYADLIGQGASVKPQYRQDMYNNADLFYQQLPFYNIRVLYVSSIYVLDKIGVNPFLASHLVSSISCFIALLLLGQIVFSRLTNHLIASFFPLLLIPFDLLHVARISTPGGLVFLFLILTLYLFLNARIKLFFCMLPILILVRTDLILLTAGLSLYFIFFNRRYIGLYLVSALISVILYLAVNAYFGNLGWSTVFYLTFIGPVHTLTETPSITPAVYIQVFIEGLKDAVHRQAFVIYALSTLFIFIYQLKNKLPISELTKDGLVVFHYIGLFYVAVHFVLFPVMWERFFLAQYATTLILALSIILNLTGQSASARQGEAAI